MTRFEYNLAKKAGILGGLLNDRINELIRKRYSMSNELAILRQRDVKPEEFEEYNAYAEQCKEIAKAEFAIFEE